MRFTVKFIDLEKTTTITAPDLVYAEEWALHQLASWRKDSDFDVEEAATEDHP